MANQISKQAILEFLNERYEERSKNRNQSTEGKYFYLNDGAITFINSLILNIEAGRFDENISDELKRLYEWREQAILNDDSFTVQDINKEIKIVKNKRLYLDISK